MITHVNNVLVCSPVGVLHLSTVLSSVITTLKGENMKRFIPTKKTRKCLVRHTKRRAVSRYGLYITNHDVSIITNHIQRGLSLFAERLSQTKSLHIIQYNDQYIRLVYDNIRKAPATFLPIYDNREIECQNRLLLQ